MADSNSPKRTVKTADTLFGVIEILYEEEVTVAEVAERLEIARSTAHDHLVTLEEMNYIVKEDGKYRLGLEFLRLGMNVKTKMALPEVAQPTLERLANDTEETVRLYVMEHDMAVIIDLVKGPRGVVTGGAIGTRLPLHWTAAGKAMMAHLPESEIQRIVDEYDLPSRTENTITDLETLRTELEEIRETEVAFNDEEAIKGLRAVGCPIVTDKTVHGAISIGIPTSRLTGADFREEVLTALKGAANEIELKISYQ
jgi:IclR family acetate operon transcriptional repressor